MHNGDDGFKFYQKPSYYYDINGDKVANFAMAYGPHANQQCECEGCSTFNSEHQSREEQYLLLKKVEEDANKYLRMYYNSPQGFGIDRDGYHMQMVMMEFAKKQISDYQQIMFRKFSKINTMHGNLIKRGVSTSEVTRRKLNAERLEAGQGQDGRLFRVEDEAK